MTHLLSRAVLVGLLLAVSGGVAALSAQGADDDAYSIGELERTHPELADLFGTLEDAHRALFAALASRAATPAHAEHPIGHDADGAGGDQEFEARVLETLLATLSGEVDDHAIREESASEGETILGARVDEIMRRTYRLHREIFDIYSDAEIVDKFAAVDEAVERYRSRPEVAVPAVPKSMDLVHDRPYAGAFRNRYPELNGVIWAGHWLQLAASDPILLFTAPEARSEGVDTTIERFHAKLSQGEPPNAFPTELPMVPTIAPALLARHPGAAAVMDNLHMLLDVVAAILADPEFTDRQSAIEEAADQFTDPDYRIASERDWIVMALRHGIFNQGGPAIGTLTRSERNQGGHSHHGDHDGHMVLPGMGGGM